MARAKSENSGRLDLVLLALFFALGCAWLVAPFLHGLGIRNLHFISNFEAYGQPWSWAFRLGDFFSAALLVTLIYRFKIVQKDKLMGWALLAIATLAAIDVVFPLTCQAGATNFCQVTSSFSSTIHKLETGATAIVILLAIGLDIWRRRDIFSWLFLPVQILFIAFAMSSGISDSTLAPLQFVYQIVLLVWLVYVLEQFSSQPSQKLIARKYRLALAIWAGLNGLFSLVIAAGHLKLYGASFALYSAGHSSWIPQETALAGILLLYLARQIYRGQRRAAYVLAVIFGVELVKYSLFDPRPVLVVIYGLTFILIFLVRESFNRNIGRINIHERLYDFLVTLGGVVVALATVALILVSLGRFNHAEHLLAASGGYFKSFYSQHFPDKLKSDRLAQTAGVVVATTIGASVWIFFRPAKFYNEIDNEDRRLAEQILKKYSGNSDDYFKFWPADKAYFFSSTGRGFIAYKVTIGIALALADPVGPASEIKKLLAEFRSFCIKNGWTACFVPVGESSRKLYEGFSFQQIGASAVIDIAKFSSETRRDKWWRWKINQATKAGLAYKTSDAPHDAKFLAQLRSVSDAWLGDGRRQEQTFGQGYFDIDYLNDCRLHYLENSSGKIVAFTNELPVYSGRQATIDFLRYRPEESAAMPFLLARVIEKLGEEAKFTTFDLGLVPFAQMNQRSVKLARALAKNRFSMSGLEQFKNKFDPSWQAQFLAYDGDKLDLPALATALESAFKFDS